MSWVLLAWAVAAAALPAAAGEHLGAGRTCSTATPSWWDGIHVRLKGVAAPEVTHFDKSGEPGGEAAKAFMVELIEGQTGVCDTGGGNIREKLARLVIRPD